MPCMGRVNNLSFPSFHHILFSVLEDQFIKIVLIGCSFYYVELSVVFHGSNPSFIPQSS